jgi:hypothetical protein
LSIHFFEICLVSAWGAYSQAENSGLVAGARRRERWIHNDGKCSMIIYNVGGNRC